MAHEKDYEENLTISNYSVKFYYQYNPSSKSHVYFASGNSINEISWMGKISHYIS